MSQWHYSYTEHESKLVNIFGKIFVNGDRGMLETNQPARKIHSEMLTENVLKWQEGGLTIGEMRSNQQLE